jgi:hypothetical protein
MRKGFMLEPHNQTGKAVIIAAATITIISGILEIIEMLCRWLL